MKKTKILTIQAACGRKQNIPKIQTQGAYLARLGYQVGDKLSVIVTSKYILIFPVK